MSEQTEPTCYRVASLAKRWDCSPGKIRNLLKTGELTCLRLGKMVRIPAISVHAFEAKCQDQTLLASAASQAEPPGTSITSGVASLRAARIARCTAQRRLSMDNVERVAKAIAKANDDDFHWKGYAAHATAAIAAMDGWRPIEEAPPRKTLIGWAESWAEPELIWKAADSEPWQEGECGDYVDLGFEPTHFLPIPAPPQHGGVDG
jgi:hypothetical protein